MLVHIRQRVPERLKDHLPVLLAYDLIPRATGWIDGLLSNRSHLGYDLWALCLEYALEYTRGMVEEVRHGLLHFALRCHVEGLSNELLRIPVMGPVINLTGHVLLLFFREIS